MVMRSDNSTSFPQGSKMEISMAKAKIAPKAHHVVMGDAAHAGMRHLAASGQQSISVAQEAIEFAELQDEGPTARAPMPVNSNRFQRR